MKIYKPFNGLHYGSMGPVGEGDEAMGRACPSSWLLSRASLSACVCLGPGGRQALLQQPARPLGRGAHSCGHGTSVQ